MTDEELMTAVRRELARWGFDLGLRPHSDPTRAGSDGVRLVVEAPPHTSTHRLVCPLAFGRQEDWSPDLIRARVAMVVIGLWEAMRRMLCEALTGRGLGDEMAAYFDAALAAERAGRVGPVVEDVAVLTG